MLQEQPPSVELLGTIGTSRSTPSSSRAFAMLPAERLDEPHQTSLVFDSLGLRMSASFSTAYSWARRRASGCSESSWSMNITYSVRACSILTLRGRLGQPELSMRSTLMVGRDAAKACSRTTVSSGDPSSTRMSSNSSCGRVCASREPMTRCTAAPGQEQAMITLTFYVTDRARVLRPCDRHRTGHGPGEPTVEVGRCAAAGQLRWSSSRRSSRLVWVRSSCTASSILPWVVPPARSCLPTVSAGSMVMPSSKRSTRRGST